MARVCEALDYMHANNITFGGRFELLSASDRGIGSFGVVQLASVRVLQVRILKPITCQKTCIAQHVVLMFACVNAIQVGRGDRVNELQ